MPQLAKGSSSGSLAANTGKVAGVLGLGFAHIKAKRKGSRRRVFFWVEIEKGYGEVLGRKPEKRKESRGRVGLAAAKRKKQNIKRKAARQPQEEETERVGRQKENKTAREKTKRGGGD